MKLADYKRYLNRVMPALRNKKVDNDLARARWRHISFFVQKKGNSNQWLAGADVDFASVRNQLEIGYLLREKPTTVLIIIA